MESIINVARKFNKKVESVEHIATCRNIIYKAICKDYNFVLRLTDKEANSEKELESELSFQEYLYKNGANVAKPLSINKNKKVIKCFIDEKEYYVSAFTFEEGLNWYERDDITPKTLYQIGKAIGKVHKLSKEYNENCSRRREWYESKSITEAFEIFKDYSTDLYNAFTEYIEKMRLLENNRDTYGLTHGDYLMSNYLIKDEEVTIIDFNECEYSWYAMDLAICIRCYLVGDMPEYVSEKENLAELIHYNLLLGYQSENKLTQDMIYNMDRYILLRDYIEILQILKNVKQGRVLCDIENRLLKADLDRVLYNKPFVKFRLDRVLQLDF